MSKRQTQERWLCRLVRDGGPLGQAFIVDALDKLSNQVLAIPDDKLDELFKESFVNGHAWKTAARNMRDALDDRVAEIKS